MAADTAQKRYSAYDLTLPWRGPRVVPTGTVDAGARAAAFGLYAGITGGAVVAAVVAQVRGGWAGPTKEEWLAYLKQVNERQKEVLAERVADRESLREILLEQFAPAPAARSQTTQRVAPKPAEPERAEPKYRVPQLRLPRIPVVEPEVRRRILELIIEIRARAQEIKRQKKVADRKAARLRKLRAEEEQILIWMSTEL